MTGFGDSSDVVVQLAVGLASSIRAEDVEELLVSADSPVGGNDGRTSVVADFSKGACCCCCDLEMRTTVADCFVCTVAAAVFHYLYLHLHDFSPPDVTPQTVDQLH